MDLDVENPQVIENKIIQSLEDDIDSEINRLKRNYRKNPYDNLDRSKKKLMDTQDLQKILRPKDNQSAS